ncbi:MAG: acetyl-CoA carboxylase carboxyltransferase subunit alpha [Sphingomonadaceae bacterium]
MNDWLDFERPVAALAKQAEAAARAGDLAGARQLQARADRQLADLYGRLTPWQRTQVARHPRRPQFRHLADVLFDELLLLGGDRLFAEDAAILGGPARFNGRPAMVLGHMRGDTTETRIAHNFGMARPEGYRKAVRLMQLADRFGLPVVSIVDTSGAFPGVDAEARGQAEAIARSTEACLALGVPHVALILGEGGSGGAIALAAASEVLMLEHAIYSVISPEGCASILWREGAGRAADAAEALRLTAPDLKALGVIDRIVFEPPGGAHRDPATAIQRIGLAITESLDRLAALDSAQLRAARRSRFLRFAGL